MLEECTTFSVWQRKTVPTIKVHPQMDEGSNIAPTRLQEVIDSAPHFSKVLILGGTYTEQLVISKAIELCGEEDDEPTISSRGPTIAVSSDVPCFFSCLKIKVKSLTSSSGSRTDPPAVSMSTGKAVFFRCEITSVYVAGSAAPVIERCLIQGNAGGSGLVVRDSASGSYLTNEITDHNLYCLEVMSKGSPKFVNNDIHTTSEDPNVNPGCGLVRVSGGGAGQLSLAIHGEVAPTFTGNKFQDSFSDEQRNNAQALFGSDKRRMFYPADMGTQRVAVAIEYANPVFQDNTIDGGIVGMSIVGGNGTYTSNVVQLSLLCGVYISRGCQAKFTNNKMTQHSGGGVYVESCSPCFLSSTIMQCRGVGITVNHSRDILISKCLIEKCRVGVSIAGNTAGSLSENQIQRNELMGIRVADQACRTRLLDNTLQMNGTCGIYLIQNCMPVLERNIIHSQKTGVMCTTGAYPTATKNHVYGNEQFAVVVQENANGEWRQNKIANGAVAAVRVADRSYPTFEDNSIDDASVGMFCTNRSAPRFLRNTLRGHGDGINISNSADPLIEGNTFSNCSRYGAFCFDDALGTVTNNTFTNMTIGIGCFKGAETVIRANVIERARQVGGVLGEGSRGLLEKNTFNACIGHGLVLTGHRSNSRVLGCNFFHNDGYGVLSEKTGGGVVEKCFFTANKTAGFGSEEEGQTRFVKNRSLEDVGPGIQVVNNGGGRFLHNVVEDGRTVGCRIGGGGRPTVQHCVFRNCHGSGLDLIAGAEGEVCDSSIEACKVGIAVSGAGCRTYLGKIYCSGSLDAGALLGPLVEVQIEKCTFENQSVGIRLQNCGPAVIQDCSLLNNDRGIICEKGGQCSIVSTTVSGSSQTLVEINDGGNLTVKESVLEKCKGIGILAKNKCTGLFVETKVLMCDEAGVVLESHADPKFELCTISENKTGVIVRDQSLGSFADTSILENIECNVVCKQRSAASFVKCIIAVCKEGSGVHCSQDLSKFTDTQIQRNRRHGFICDAMSRAVLKGCVVQHNHMSGIYCLPRSEPTVTGCKLIENNHSGVLIMGEAAPNFHENEVSDNVDVGVLCLSMSRGQVQRNTLKGNNVANVRLLADSQTAVINNQITSGKPSGIIIEGSASKVEGNNITNHSHCGVYVVGMSTCVLTHNTVSQNHNGIVFEAAGKNVCQPPAGVDTSLVAASQMDDYKMSSSLQYSGKHTSSPTHAGSPTNASSRGGTQNQRAGTGSSGATVSTNSFSGNRSSAVVLLRGAAPLITQNNFLDGEIGVTVTTAALGIVEHNTFSNNSVSGIDIVGNLIETKIRLNTFENNTIGITIKFNNRVSVAAVGRGYTPTQHALSKLAHGNEGGAEGRLETSQRAKQRQRRGSEATGFNSTAMRKKSLLSAVNKMFADVPESNEQSRNAQSFSRFESGEFSGDDDDAEEEDESEGGTSTDEEDEDKRSSRTRSVTPKSAEKIRITTIILKNRFVENKSYGVFASEGSETQIVSNDFSAELCGVSGTGNSSLQVSENTFARCCVGVHLATGTNFKVTRNQFTDANQIGLYSSGGTGEVLKNVFSLCLIAGVCVEQNGAPTVSRNLFAYNATTELTAGIYTRRGGGGFFGDNDLHENSIGIRCDAGGLGTFTNCFIHDNVLGVHATSGGKCTIGQTFFSDNKVADVYSAFGGAPILNRCVLYDSAKPFLIRDFGGGIFSFNVIKNVEGSAILIQFPTTAVHEVRLAEIRALKKRELDMSHVARPVLSNDDTISRQGVAMLAVMDPKTMNSEYRVAPTFSSNLIVNCGVGVEIDLGETPKDKLARGSTSKKASLVTGDPSDRKMSTRKSVSGGPSASTGAEDSNTMMTRKAKALAQARYVSPMPDLQTLQRGDYWAFFTQNVIQQCITGVLCHNGVTSRPPKFRPLYEGHAQQQAALVATDDEDPAVGPGGVPAVLSGPSMEEFERDSDPRTAVKMTDDVFMCYFDGNTVMGNDIGILMRHGGNARFERNYIAKCMRTGVMVTDEGRGEFYENVMTDCTQGYCVNVLGDQMRGASSSSVQPCYANFQWNVMSNGKTCVVVSAPEVRFHKNRISAGEQGLLLYSAASGLFHLNIVFENRKIGCMCMSEPVILNCNWFYSSLDSAIEMKIEAPGASNRIPPSNAIKNQFTPRFSRPDPANKISLTSDHVSEVKSAKDQRELFQLLRDLHDQQLPSCGALGCSRIGVQGSSRDDAEAFRATKQRVMMAKFVLTEEGIKPAQPPTSKVTTFDGADASRDSTVSGRGIRFVADGGQGASESQGLSSGFGGGSVFGGGGGSVFGSPGGSVFGSVGPTSTHAPAAMFRASSGRFGRQADGGLAPSSSIRPKAIQTMDEMRNELRGKREEREKQNRSASKTSGEDDSDDDEKAARRASAAARRKSSAAALLRLTSSPKLKKVVAQAAAESVAESAPKRSGGNLDASKAVGEVRRERPSLKSSDITHPTDSGPAETSAYGDAERKPANTTVTSVADIQRENRDDLFSPAQSISQKMAAPPAAAHTKVRIVGSQSQPDGADESEPKATTRGLFHLDTAHSAAASPPGSPVLGCRSLNRESPTAASSPKHRASAFEAERALTAAFGPASDATSIGWRQGSPAGDNRAASPRPSVAAAAMVASIAVDLRRKAQAANSQSRDADTECPPPSSTLPHTKNNETVTATPPLVPKEQRTAKIKEVMSGNKHQRTSSPQSVKPPVASVAPRVSPPAAAKQQHDAELKRRHQPTKPKDGKVPAAGWSMATPLSSTVIRASNSPPLNEVTRPQTMQGAYHSSSPQRRAPAPPAHSTAPANVLVTALLSPRGSPKRLRSNAPNSDDESGDTSESSDATLAPMSPSHLGVPVLALPIVRHRSLPGTSQNETNDTAATSASGAKLAQRASVRFSTMSPLTQLSDVAERDIIEVGINSDDECLGPLPLRDADALFELPPSILGSATISVPLVSDAVPRRSSTNLPDSSAAGHSAASSAAAASRGSARKKEALHVKNIAFCDEEEDVEVVFSNRVLALHQLQTKRLVVSPQTSRHHGTGSMGPRRVSAQPQSRPATTAQRKSSDSVAASAEQQQPPVMSAPTVPLLLTDRSSDSPGKSRMVPVGTSMYSLSELMAGDSAAASGYGTALLRVADTDRRTSPSHFQQATGVGDLVIGNTAPRRSTVGSAQLRPASQHHQQPNTSPRATSANVVVPSSTLQQAFVLRRPAEPPELSPRITSASIRQLSHMSQAQRGALSARGRVSQSTPAAQDLPPLPRSARSTSQAAEVRSSPPPPIAVASPNGLVSQTHATTINAAQPSHSTPTPRALPGMFMQRGSSTTYVPFIAL